MTETGYPTAAVEGFTLGMFVSYDDCGDAWCGHLTAASPH